MVGTEVPAYCNRTDREHAPHRTTPAKKRKASLSRPFSAHPNLRIHRSLVLIPVSRPRLSRAYQTISNQSHPPPAPVSSPQLTPPAPLASFMPTTGRPTPLHRPGEARRNVLASARPVRTPAQRAGPRPCGEHLPDVAGVGWHHGLADMAVEGLAELCKVLHRAIRPELARRMRIGPRRYPLVRIRYV
jgi:hypothetical protein